MKITAILVTHNEFPMLTDWLWAVSKWADEIIVGLHDCTDQSKEMLDTCIQRNVLKVPIKIVEFPADVVAEHGFSYPKNKLGEMATGDWIVSLDTDEEMEVTRESLEKLIGDAEAAGKFAIQTQTFEPRTQPGEKLSREELRSRMQYSNLYHWRIYKARVGVKWMGMIHEALHLHGQEINPFTLWQNEVRMLHFGPGLGHIKNKEKSDLLYCELICRAFDFPHLQVGTNRWWFDTHYFLAERYLREQQEEFWRRRGKPKYSELLDDKSREMLEGK